jgi:hypothetical protein
MASAVPSLFIYGRRFLMKRIDAGAAAANTP